MLSSEFAKLLPLTEPARMPRPADAAGITQQTGKTGRNAAASGGQDLPPGGENRPASESTVAEAVNHLNEFAQSIKRNLEFSVDEDSGRIIIKVIDSATKEIIRQIPPEDALSMVRNLNGEAGMFVHVEA